MIPEIHSRIVIEDNCLHIELNESLSYIYVQWLRHPSSHEFRTLYKKAADLAHEYGCKYWLSDARAIHYLEFADQNWLLRELAPRVAYTPLTKYARISTQESLTLMDVQRICESLEAAPNFDGKQLQIQLFLNKESALTWLFSEE